MCTISKSIFYTKAVKNIENLIWNFDENEDQNLIEKISVDNKALCDELNKRKIGIEAKLITSPGDITINDLPFIVIPNEGDLLLNITNTEKINQLKENFYSLEINGIVIVKY